MSKQIRQSRSKIFRLHHTVYSGQELRDRMLQAGFAEVLLYGDLDGNPYGPNAKRLVAVARVGGVAGYEGEDD